MGLRVETHGGLDDSVSFVYTNNLQNTNKVSAIQCIHILLNTHQQHLKFGTVAIARQAGCILIIARPLYLLLRLDA